MHRCLQILEIIAIIVDNASGEEKGLYTLNALARTCIIFQETALNALWRSQGSLSNIIRSMPEDLVCGTGAPRFNRDILPEDWDRFRYYAAKTRDITIGYYDDPQVIMSLGIQNQKGIPLFPNLRKLTWWVHWDSINLVYTTLFLVKTVQDLVFHSYAPTLELSPTGRSQFCGLLDILHCAAPLLRSLELSFAWNYNFDTPSICISSNRIQFDHLRSFESSLPLAEQTVVMLSTLPLLWKLHLRIEPPEGGFTPLPTSLRSPYRSLRVLRVNGDSLMGCLDFIESLGPLKLRFIGMDFYRYDYEGGSLQNSHISKAANILSRIHLIESLRALHFGGFCSGNGDVVELGSLDPLRALKNLEVLFFHSNCTFNGSDECLGRIVESWPRLRYLRLGSSPNYYPSKLALRCLQHIVRSCPALEYLCITIDATMDQYTPASAEELVHCGKELSTLNFRQSKLGDPVLVAMLLSRLCPNLVSIVAQDANGKEGPWKDVFKYTKAMVEMRKEGSLVDRQ